jgi:transcriptional regulator with XRE-family HTH domain
LRSDPLACTLFSMNDGPRRVNRSGRPASLSQDKHRLRRRRIAAGLTIREASVKAQISIGLISELENGKKSAGVRTLAALAKAYGCEITDLMPPETDVIAAIKAAADERVRRLLESPQADRQDAA